MIPPPGVASAIAFINPNIINIIPNPANINDTINVFFNFEGILNFVGNDILLLFIGLIIMLLFSFFNSSFSFFTFDLSSIFISSFSIKSLSFFSFLEIFGDLFISDSSNIYTPFLLSIILKIFIKFFYFFSVIIK